MSTFFPFFRSAEKRNKKLEEEEEEEEATLYISNLALDVMNNKHAVQRKWAKKGNQKKY